MAEEPPASMHEVAGFTDPEDTDRLMPHQPASALSGLWPYAGRHDECPNRAKHRGPEGPNEDISQCGGCGHVSYDMRPPGETWGWHADDCSLPVDHESYCKPGGSGHDPAPEIRGYWPHDPRSEDFRPVDNASSSPALCPTCGHWLNTNHGDRGCYECDCEVVGNAKLP